MSSLYNKEYIQSVNINRLIDYIEGRRTIDFNDLTKRKDMVVLQHYLIKYIEENGKTKNINNCLYKIYVAFGNNPELFVDSPLIKDGFINRYMPEDMKNKIKNFKNAYFDEKTVLKLYEKSKKQLRKRPQRSPQISFRRIHWCFTSGAW